MPEDPMAKAWDVGGQLVVAGAFVAGFMLSQWSGGGPQAFTPSSTHGKVADKPLTGELGERRNVVSPAPAIQVS